MDPEIFKSRKNIDPRRNQEEVKIKRDEKTITIKDFVADKIYEEDYDTLVLSPGASPIRPNLEGINNKNVFTVRNVVDIERLSGFVKQNNLKDIAVIGGGFIGVEVAENLRLAGHHVSLVEFANQVMAPYDYDMAQILHKEMTDQGVDLILDDGLAKIGEDFIETNSGRRINAQAVVLAIGVRPETSLAEDADLEIGSTGDRKSTRLNSSHVAISYAVFCLKKKNLNQLTINPNRAFAYGIYINNRTKRPSDETLNIQRSPDNLSS